MAVTISSFTLALQIQAVLSNQINGVDGPQATQGFAWTQPSPRFANGTTDGQADRVWHAKARALVSGNSENLDLYDLAAFDIGAGAGKDALGQAWTNAEVCGLIVENVLTSAGNLYIGGEGSSASFQSIFHVSGTASDTAGFGPLPPGGCIAFITPKNPAWPVVDAANHLLKFAAVGGNVTYNVCVLGRSS